jgi:hypothetical protein
MQAFNAELVMKKHMFNSLIACLLLLGGTPLSYASQSGHDKTTAKEVRQKVGDAAEAVKTYSVDKRDEAVKKAKVALDNLDSRINALEEQTDNDWEKMDKAARERARNTLKALHKQRIRVAEWYGGLKNSTANSWERVKRGFVDSYELLLSSLEKAGQDHPDKRRR